MVQGVGGEGLGGFVTLHCASEVHPKHMHFPPFVAFQTTALYHFQRCFIWRPALSPAAEATAELSAGLQNLLCGDLELPLRPHSNFNLASTSFYQPLPTSVPSYRPPSTHTWACHLFVPLKVTSATSTSAY